MYQCCPVAQSCPTLCDYVDCSTPGFPVLHHLLELAQTHVYWASDAIQPSRPLLSPSPGFSLSQRQGLFSESAPWIRWLKCWSLNFSISPSNEYSGLISFRNHHGSSWLTGLISLQSKGLSRVFFRTSIQKHQFFGTQSPFWSNSHIHTWLLEKM